MHAAKLDILSEILGPSYRTGGEYLFACPRCDHHKKKLSVNVVKDVWKCWVCEYSGFKLRRLVRKFGSYKNKKEWAELDGTIELANFDEIFRDLFDKSESEQSEQRLELPEEFRTLVTNNVSIGSIQPRKYLQDRNITREDIIKWKLGFCSQGEFKNRIIVPSFGLSGYPNYFVGRAYDDSWKAYKNPPVSRDIIFNNLFIDWTDDLTI